MDPQNAELKLKNIGIKKVDSLDELFIFLYIRDFSAKQKRKYRKSSKEIG